MKPIAMVPIIIVIFIAITNDIHAQHTSAIDAIKQLKDERKDVKRDEIIMRSEDANKTIFLEHRAFQLDRNFIPEIMHEQGYVLLQTLDPMTEDIYNELESLGVIFLDYYPMGTWKVSMPTAALAKVKQKSYIYAIGSVQPSDKFSATILENGFSSESFELAGKIRAIVTFNRDVDFESASNILEDMEVPVDLYYRSSNSFLVKADESVITSLAYLDEVKYIEDFPGNVAPLSYEAVEMSYVDVIQHAPYNLNGSGVKVGIWETDPPDRRHYEFQGATIIFKENKSNYNSGPYSTHATAVAGTLIAQGRHYLVNGTSKSSTLLYYDWGEAGEPAQDVPGEVWDAYHDDNLVISNHSWGSLIGWDGSHWYNNTSSFGSYSGRAYSFDDTVFQTGAIVIQSAGNDRNDVGTGEHPPDAGYSCLYHCPTDLVGCADCIYSGYRTISPESSAKNTISVGSINGDYIQSEFSSWGPTLDGRIKPDLVAKGESVYLPTGSPAYYSRNNGTSFSSPLVAGVATLLYQKFEDVMGYAPRASVMRAILIGSAVDLGSIGPDYQNGWGLVDAEAGVELIETHPNNIHEKCPVGGMEGAIYYVDVPNNTAELKTTLAWTDYQGTSGAEWFLVNDFELRLISPSDNLTEPSNPYYPWVLDRNAPSHAATTGDNSTDNVEQVMVQNPEPGRWGIKVSGALYAPCSFANEGSYAVVSTISYDVTASEGYVGIGGPSSANVAGCDRPLAVEGTGSRCTASPDAASGYYVHSAYADGSTTNLVPGTISWDGSGMVEFSNITAPHTLDVYFSNTYWITSTSEPGGHIVPEGYPAYTWGDDATLPIIADSGYHVSQVYVDGSPVGAVTSYTFYNITGNHTIHAAFAVN